jgi:hypothetical protein
MIMIIKLTIYVNYSSVFVAHETCMRNNRGWLLGNELLVKRGNELWKSRYNIV